MKTNTNMARLKPIVPALIAALAFTACHTPMRDTPQGRHRNKTDAGALKTKNHCAAAQVALTTLGKTPGAIDAKSVRSAEFPPAQSDTTTSRHIVFIFNRKVTSDELHLASVFINTDTCALESTYETSLEAGHQAEVAPACAPTDDDVDGKKILTRVNSAKTPSPYETWLSGSLNEQFVVDTSNPAAPTVTMELFSKDGCKSVLKTSRPLAVPGKGSGTHTGGHTGHKPAPEESENSDADQTAAPAESE